MKQTIRTTISFADWVSLVMEGDPSIEARPFAGLKPVDSTAAASPVTTGHHVHVKAQDAPTPGRASADEAAGSGE